MFDIKGDGRRQNPSALTVGGTLGVGEDSSLDLKEVSVSYGAGLKTAGKVVLEGRDT